MLNFELEFVIRIGLARIKFISKYYLPRSKRPTFDRYELISVEYLDWFDWTIIQE